MTGSVYQSNSMTYETCVTYCTNKGFAYAGLQSGSTCRCDNTYQSLGQAAASSCNSKCSGNSLQTCGGSTQLLVYGVKSCQAQATCAVLGCYNQFSWAEGYSTPTHVPCENFCQSKGYTYGGLSGTQWCFCGNSLLSTAKVSDSQCNTPCADNDGSCGGNGFYTVLQTSNCRPGGNAVLPVKDTFDWRNRGNYVTAIKDQGPCGSCWAHAGIASLESAWAIAGHGLITLSPQQIIDCSGQECQGGWMTTVYDYASKNGGIALSVNQPYFAKKDPTCNSDHTGGDLSLPNPNVEYSCQKTSSSETTASVEARLMAAVQKGPVAVAVLMDDSKVHYSNGIMLDNWQPSDSINHAVVIEGYGTDVNSGIDYWLVRNSWGTWWGENGYFKVGRGVGGNGVIGILSGCTRPLANK